MHSPGVPFREGEHPVSGEEAVAFAVIIAWKVAEIAAPGVFLAHKAALHGGVKRAACNVAS